MNLGVITVYRALRCKASETCNFGCEHEVEYFERVDLTPTGERVQRNNGYEDYDTEVFVDSDGRLYVRHVTIDFHNNISYVHEESKTHYSHREPKGLARDVLGRPLTPHTPPGPTAAELIGIRPDVAEYLKLQDAASRANREQ